MIVRGAKFSDSGAKVLYHGPLDECLAWCRKQELWLYDALDICRDDGKIYRKITRYGKPASRIY